MAVYIFLECQECGLESEIYCDGDNAMMCPECLAIDCFKEVEDDNT